MKVQSQVAKAESWLIWTGADAVINAHSIQSTRPADFYGPLYPAFPTSQFEDYPLHIAAKLWKNLVINSFMN